MAVVNKIKLVDGQGQVIQLGKLIKSGGAGSVYHIASAKGQVAKLYHDKIDKTLYRRKTSAMLALKPSLPPITDTATPVIQLAWPISQLFNQKKQFVGFVMPELDVSASIELEYILQERQAKANNLPVGLGAKIQLATNLAILVEAIHQQNHFIIDMKPVNLRFYRESLYVSMLDCDGFSIQGKQERFAAGQFTVDYLAPEFQNAKSVPQSQESQQDRFALAVILFQLLNFGIHPFSGRPLHNQVPNDLPSRIAGKYYAYGVKAHQGISPVPTSGHTFLPDDIRQLFDKAFNGAPDQRPSAAQWVQCLRPYALRSQKKMVVCSKNKEHQYFAGLKCAACERVKQLKVASEALQQTRQQQNVQKVQVRGQTQTRRVVRPQPIAPITFTPPAWFAAIKKVHIYTFLAIAIPLLMAFIVSNITQNMKPETLSPAVFYQYWAQEGFESDVALSIITLVCILGLSLFFWLGLFLPIKSILTKKP